MSQFQFVPDREHPDGWEILRVAGVPFYITTGFLFFMGIIFLFNFDSLARGSADASRLGLLCFIIFFSLMVHEGGHAFAARLLGLDNVAVSLIMFGGYTTHPPTTTGRSLLIVLAGPGSTLALAGAGWAGVHYGLDSVTNPQMQDSAAYLLKLTIFLNLFWFVFNVLPIYPMDGGQIVYYVLRFFMRHLKALRIAAYVSLAACVIGGWLMFSRGFGGIMLGYFLVIFIMQNWEIIRHRT